MIMNQAQWVDYPCKAGWRKGCYLGWICCMHIHSSDIKMGYVIYPMFKYGEEMNLQIVTC